MTAVSARRAEKLRAGKHNVDVGLVERLIAAQFPQWSGLPVREVAFDGWDNWTFRLGDSMKVRLPSDAGYVPQVEKEAEWLPRLAPLLPVPIPAPIAVGAPGEGYPWPWTICNWIEGDTAGRDSAANSVDLARDIAGFLRQLQAIEPAGGPPAGVQSSYRGAPLEVYDGDTQRCLAALEMRIDTRAARAVWDAAVASTFEGPPVWFHGDIAAGNLLVQDGRLRAVLDFGCSGIGDPACDLVLSWVFFDGPARAGFREAVAMEEETWVRARGWALWKAMLLLENGSVTHPAENCAAKVVEAVIAEQRNG
jgi:aminoglycoside phosphotransferase (APT) family kinase protein